MEDKNEKLEETKEVKKEDKKKSHVLLVTVLMILLLVAFFGFGYALGGTKIVNEVKEQNEEEKKEPVVKEYDVTDEKVANLINNLFKMGFFACDVHFET